VLRVVLLGVLSRIHILDVVLLLVWSMVDRVLSLYRLAGGNAISVDFAEVLHHWQRRRVARRQRVGGRDHEVHKFGLALVEEGF
jgi:hypothetical protein